MSGLDIALIALIVFGVVRGLMKGLFVEVASVIALIAGVYGAIHFSGFVATFIDGKLGWDGNTVEIAAFAITFLVIVLAIALAGKALTKLADFAALGLVNKLLGALFGAFKITLILSVVLNIFDGMNSRIPLTDEKSVEDSVLYNPIKSIIPGIFPILLEKKHELEERLREDPSLIPSDEHDDSLL